VTALSAQFDTLLDAELRSSRRAEQVMSMPALRRRRWTIEEVERLVDEREELSPRYELVNGELLVTPAPNGRHQRIILALTMRLQPYVVLHRLGEIRLGPGEARLTRDSRFEPDIFLIPAIDGRMPRAADPVTRLSLAIEVLSPSSARHDRITKRRFFQSHGVPEYWVVDGEAEAFEVWHPSDERAALLDERLVWQPGAEVAPFELDVKTFFASVADEPRA
jgi:Uma2 family endonuclease